MAVWLSLSLSQGTPNVTARTTTVSATLTIHYSGGSYDGTQPSGEITIDGQSFPFVKNFNYAGVGQGAASQGTGSTSITVTATVSYGASSSRTVNASASFSRASGGASGSITLTPISTGGSSGGGDDDDDNTEEWDPDNPGSGSGSGDSSQIVANVKVHRESLHLSPGDAESIRFTTPEFSGRSTLLIVSLHTDSSYVFHDMPVNVALCSSDANLAKYSNGSEEVSDVYQLATTSTTMSIYSYSVVDIQTTALRGGTDYYIILWNPTSYVAIDKIAMGVNYTDDGSGDDGGDDSGDDGGDDSGDDGDIVTPTTRGVFYIDNGIEYTAYQCYIDNGTSWDPVGGESGYSRNTGSITLTSASQSVSCGFAPDVVVLTGLSYTSSSSGQLKELQLTAVFTEKTTANTLRATAYNDDTEWIEVEITQTATGFILANFYAIDDDGYTNIPSMQFNYVAIKYT